MYAQFSRLLGQTDISNHMDNKLQNNVNNEFSILIFKKKQKLNRGCYYEIRFDPLLLSKFCITIKARQGLKVESGMEIVRV